jgi:serine/threonine-protein kinase HipA
LIVTDQIKIIKTRWSKVCNEAQLTEVDRNFLWRREFQSPYAFVGAPEAVTELAG